MGKILTGIFLFTFCTFANVAQVLTQESSGYLLEKDIFYRTVTKANQDEYLAERCKLDIYYPENQAGFVTVVWFHGGGIKAGNKYITEKLKEKMMFGDTSRRGVPFSKDPHVVKFNGKYLMYFSIPPFADKSNPIQGWNIGIAESTDLINWKKTGEINPAGGPESKGLCAPCAKVIDGKVHLFYQTYGNGRNDAICHAVSNDGIGFNRNPTNPIFKPTGDWNCGRAIDAELIQFKNKYLLYFATRDPDYEIQMQGVAEAPLNTNFNRGAWTQISETPMMVPEYDWEGKCVEGASVIQRGDELFMFYAGSYNNAPQQVGIAKSSDGVHWEKLSETPFLPNGKPGEWNASESGHPHIFLDEDGRTYLFFQGNNTNGKDWYISNVEVYWNENGPYLKK